MIRRIGLVAAMLFLLVTLFPASPEHAQTSSNTQIILSGTGLPASPAHPCTPWGMWLWSQPGTNNAYGGTTGNGDGSIYFYGIHPAEAHADVSDVVLSGNSVSESASGTYADGTSVSCTFKAHQTSPGKGILDSMSCTVTPPDQVCTATDIPITVDISNGTK
jgi:hypothetical protein